MRENKKRIVVVTEDSSDEVVKFKDGVVGVLNSANSDYEVVVSMDKANALNEIGGEVYDGAILWTNSKETYMSSDLERVMTDNNMPIVSMRNILDVTNDNYFFVGSDYVQAGRELSAEIQNYFDTESINGEVLVLVDPEQSFTAKIKEGVEENFIPVVLEVPNNDEEFVKTLVAEKLSEYNGDIKAIVCYSDKLAISLLPFCNDYPELRLTGFGGTSVWQNYTQTGGEKIIASYVENYAALGAAAADIVDYFFNGEDVTTDEVAVDDTIYKSVIITGASYLIGEFSYPFPITVGEVTAYIEIRRKPQRLVYEQGEKIDLEGLCVKYIERRGDRYLHTKNFYGDECSIVEPTNYVLGSNKIRVIHTVGDKIVGADFYVTVKKTYELFDTTMNGRAEYFDNPKIDLKNGKLRFVNPDMVSGENSFSIGVSHVYVSNDDLIASRFKDTGKNWKLDIEQYLLKSDDGTEYRLCDNLGVTHCFKKFDDSRFYDELDAGTILKEKSDGAVLIDAKGNKVKFDSTGRIAYTEADLNSLIKKCYEYSSGRLARVYDERNKKNGVVEQAICLDYDENGKLKSLTKVYNESVAIERISFVYNDKGRLIATYATAFEDGEIIAEKLVNVYEYDLRGLLTKIINAENKSAVEISYDSNGKAYKVAKGIVYDAEQKITDEFYCATKFKEKTFHKVDETNKVGGVLTEAKISNERGVKSLLQFNKACENVSSFELVKDKKLTLMREYGKKVFEGIYDSDTINGEKYLSRSSISESCSFDDEMDENGKLSGKGAYLNYSLSLWLNISETPADRVRVKVRAFKAGKEWESVGYAACDEKAVGVWQKVTVPINFDSVNRKKNADTIVLSIETIGGVSVYGKICCCRIVPGEPRKLVIGGADYTAKLLQKSDTNTVVIEKSDGSLINAISSKSTYLTQEDLLRAITEPICTGTQNGVKIYDLITNGGKNRITSVVKVYSAEIDNFLRLASSDNIYFENKAVNNGSITRDWFVVAYDLNGKPLLTTMRTVKSFKNGIYGAASDEDVSSTASVQFDCYGRVKSETDSYRMVTKYNYDNNPTDKNYGMLMSKYVYGAGSSSDKFIVFENKTDEEGKNVTETTDGVISSGVMRDKQNEVITGAVSGSYSDFGSLIGSDGTPATDKRKQTYTFDDYLSQITKVTETVGDVSLSNEMTFENGSLRTVTDGILKYGFKEDIQKDIVEITEFKSVSMENEFPSVTVNGAADTEYTIVKKEAMQYKPGSGFGRVKCTVLDENGDVVSSTEVTTGKYGKMSSSSTTENGTSKRVSIIYERGFSGSEACANVKEISDGYEGKTYKYEYDESGSLTGWRSIENSKQVLAVQEIGAGETKYSFGPVKENSVRKVDEKYKTKIEYDTSDVIAPRVTKTSVWKDVDGNNEDNWLYYGPYINSYTYDNFGRLKTISKAKGINGSQTETFEYADKENQAIPLVKKLSHKNDLGQSHRNCEQTVTYDDKGRVLSNNIAFTSTFSDGEVYTERKSYTYDDFDRITSETINRVKHLYAYDVNGRLTNRGGTRIRYTNDYGKETGRVFEVGGVGVYRYDNYGNRISRADYEYHDVELEHFYYTRGNLLAKIDNQGAISTYKYDRNGIRTEKDYRGSVTKYYNDGAKILGEDKADGAKIRYFYKLTGLDGFSVTKNGTTNHYNYIRDAFGNVVLVEDENGTPLVKYEYDILGNCIEKVCVGSLFWTYPSEVPLKYGDFYNSEDYKRVREILDYSPFKWKSYYQDIETGYYYISGRYYDSATGTNIDADDIESVGDRASIIGGLERNAPTRGNFFGIAANGFDITTSDKLTPDITYTPAEEKSWWEKNWLNVIITTIRFAIGFACLFIPGAQGIGVSMLIGVGFSVAAMVAAVLCPGVATVLDGLGTMGTGASAISTGISLFGCNPVLNVLGVISIVVGAATVAAGLNQVVCGAIGTNVMKEVFRMSDSVYEAVYLGLNIASMVCAITGQIAIGLKGVQCFIGGTLVATEDGLKPIENIEVGDKVLAYDEETGEQAYKKVVRLFRNETYEWYHIFVNDEEIVCTGGHPFYSTKYDKFIAAKDLETDDKLLFSNGEYGIINRIEVELLVEPQTTYNFEVEDYHTYYVGENEVLTHNKCVVKDGDYQAIVNEFNETEAPHAHILKNKKRVAVVGATGSIVKGSKQRGIVQFVSKHKNEIIDGIEKFYPKR